MSGFITERRLWLLLKVYCRAFVVADFEMPE
jgi:hypothetical protein